MTSAQPLSFEFRSYRRPFRQTLKTNHGMWKHREGIILKITDRQGRAGFGEIAPLPWFGTETQAQALNFCAQLPTQLFESDAFTILPSFPACRFGFAVALDNIAHSDPRSVSSTHQLAVQRCCALLPTGKAALSAWPALWATGHRTFKWKIGVAPVAVELAWLSQLMKKLPLGARLRLDANGGLCELSAHHWMDACDRLGHRIDFIEQPLPPARFDELMKLADRYKTPIALDESISSLEQLKMHYYRGWEGIYVLKAAILGDPGKLKQFCSENPIDVVVSSVFETDIGRQALIDLATELETLLPDAPRRALGLGTQRWLPDDGLNDSDWEALWQRLHRLA